MWWPWREPSLSGNLVFRRSDGSLGEASLDAADRVRARVPVNDAGGYPEQAPTRLLGRWMHYSMPRIRSAVLGRPRRPFAHQDEAVFTRLRARGPSAGPAVGEQSAACPPSAAPAGPGGTFPRAGRVGRARFAPP